MRKILSLLMAVAFLFGGATSMWADSSTKTEGFEKATAGTNYQSTVTISEDDSDCGIGWKIYYGTPSTNDKISGNNSVQMRYYNNKDDRGYVQSTTAVEGLSNVAFKARVSSLDMKLTVSYSADGSAWTALATNVALEKTGAQGVKEFNYDIPSGGKYIKIEVAEGSTKPSSGNIKLIIDDVVFTYTASDPEPESTVKTIYCKCEQSWWKKDGAAVAAHYWKDGGEGTTWPGVRMTAVDGETDLWKIDVDLAKYEKIIFVRVNASGDIADWGAKSGDQTIPTDDKNLFTITSTSEVWGNPGVEGTWSKYDAGSTPEPPTPAEKDSIFFVNVPGWDKVNVHLWGGTAAATTWPGVAMTKLGDDDKINGFDVYKYVADKGAYKNCIFNDGTNQTADLDWTSGKYFCDGKWYAKADIPAPAVPLQGNIWKVTDKTPVIAGSHYIDETLLKVDGVYATTLKPNTRTIAGEDFTHAIQVRTDGYPSADNLVGKEKEGSTSLVITAKENVDVTFYYNRQVVGEGGTENDNKDLIVFDQAAITTKLTGVFTIAEILEGGNYLNATKKLALKKDHVYTVTASGTTIQLHGIKLEEHIPNMEIAGQWDVKEDESWVVNHMTLADDAKTASYEVELAKGDYEFKVLKDGAWLTKANDGAYGLHREWPGVAGVKDDAANNLKVTADAAGTYTFTWTFENDSIGITFPAPETPAKFYVTGDSALIVDAGYDKAKAWNADAIKSEKDTIELSLKGGQDYQLQVVVGDAWKGYSDLSVKADGLTPGGEYGNNICFKLKEAGKVKVVYFVKEDKLSFELMGDFYVAPKKDLFLVPNQWAEGEAKMAAWTWSKDGAISAFTEFFAPKAEGNDTLVAKVLAEADSIIFVRFNKDATEPKWNGGEGYQWNQTPNDSIQWEKGIFTITNALEGGYFWAGTWDVYTPEPPATFYITGNAALVGEDLKWNAQAVKATASTYTFVGLHANTEYLLKVIEDGNWDGGKVYGYSNLSEKAEGLSADHDDNIVFQLAEDGDVTVTYYWEEVVEDVWGMTFKVEGNFYVAPKKDLFLVPNQWAEGDAKIAAWTWSKDGSVNAFTEFFAPKAEGNDTLVAKVLAEADSIIFVRFNKDATEPKWNGGEGYQWNQTPNTVIMWDKAVFTILPGGDYMTNGTWDAYIPTPARLADGFYLIGQKGWDVAALSADLLFEANPENTSEYQLTVNLVKDEGIKVVRVESDVIKQWYPDGEGNDYKVDADHEGLKTIYFKPEYDSNWAEFGGYFYIEKNTSTAIDSTAADTKAVKAIRDGQLLIIRDGKTYTVQGVVVR